MSQPEYKEPDLTLARSAAELELKQAACASLFGLGSGERWDVDLDAGRIVFTADQIVAEAPVQIVGTYNTADGTWLWGWDHPSVEDELAEAARLCRAFGERHGLTRLTERKLACSQEEAWSLTALALHLFGGAGAYRGPSGATLVFMVFGDVTLSKRCA